MLLLALVIPSILIASGCTRTGGASQELVVTGSTTLLPIAEISAERFSEENDARVLVSGVGSSAGIESVSSGSSDIGTSSRELKEEEQDLGLFDTPVAVDAIAVIVNPSNPVNDLSTEQIRSIFSGEITNWSQLGGPDHEIGVVNRDEASGTREAFSKIVMGDASFDRSAAVLPGTGQVRSVVAAAEGAIGYISVGFVTDEVKAVSVDGVSADMESVRSGDYPIQRMLHFFTVHEPAGLSKAYIDYVLSEDVQEGVVRDAGFLPISTMGER